jgi:hypothetical protein
MEIFQEATVQCMHCCRFFIKKTGHICTGGYRKHHQKWLEVNNINKSKNTKEILNSLKENKWISVKDKLPLKGQRVLCVQNPETIATREALFAIFDGERFNDPEATTDGIHRCIAHWVDIIYWMPLPEIQKETL